MLCHDRAVLKATYQGHSTARHGHGMTCVNYHRLSRDGICATFCRLPRGVPRRWLREAYKSVKMLDKQFGYFRLPRGLTRTRQCRRMEWARYGMCKLAFSADYWTVPTYSNRVVDIHCIYSMCVYIHTGTERGLQAGPFGVRIPEGSGNVGSPKSRIALGPT
jgi:hypothetical protein